MSVTPIIKKYMEENNIRMVLDKQGVILGDTKLEITAKIIDILNKEVTSIKVD
jgi:Skp family chaperone for outer membrane proteins